MTSKEMRNEIERIMDGIYQNLDPKTTGAITRRKQELMRKTRVNTTKAGTQRYYLPSSATKEVVEDYLTNLINAMYDVCGYCF